MRLAALTPCPFTLIAAALLTGTMLAAHAEETAGAPKTAPYQKALKSIEAEMANSIAIFQEEAQAGKEADGWRAEVKEAALEWVRDDLSIRPPPPPPSVNDPAAQRAVLAMNRQRSKGFETRSKLPPPASFLMSWLTSRISILRGQQNTVLTDYADELTLFAEERWLKAEKPADLQPVAAAFAELNSLAPNYLAQTQLPGPMTRPILPEISPTASRGMAALQDPRRVEAFYAALFTAGDDPLVFPNPKTDVAGYTKARVTWSLLLLGKTPFQTRPRVTARIAELDAEYDALRDAARERLAALVVKNTSAVTFDSALSYFNSFQDHFDPRMWGLPPQTWTRVGVQQIPQMPMVMSDGEGHSFLQYANHGPIHDYHDLLGPRPGAPPNPMMGGMPWAIQERQIQNALASNSTSGIHRSYRLWLDYRRAEESGAAPAELATRREELCEHMNLLPSEVQSAIRNRNATAGARDITVAPASPPVPAEAGPIAELIAALDAVTARLQSGDATGSPNDHDLQDRTAALLNEWRGIHSKATEANLTDDRPGAAAMTWQSLAERPDCLTLFPLREKAARYALAQILGKSGSGVEETLPIRKALEIALEKAGAEGDWPRFHPILRLDAAAHLLTYGGHHAWDQIGKAFEQAAAESKASPSTARNRYIEILQATENDAMAASAARRLKMLQGKATIP